MNGSLALKRTPSRPPRWMFLRAALHQSESGDARALSDLMMLKGGMPIVQESGQVPITAFAARILRSNRSS